MQLYDFYGFIIDILYSPIISPYFFAGGMGSVTYLRVWSPGQGTDIGCALWMNMDVVNGVPAFKSPLLVSSLTLYVLNFSEGT